VADAGQRLISPAVWAAALGGLVVAALTVVSRPPEARVATALLLLAGLAAGAGAGLVVARAQAARGRGGRAGRRTVMERMNDGAFGAVMLAAWGVSLAVLGAWAGLLAGFGAGLLVALLARRG
jgi:hypothetical protein